MHRDAGTIPPEPDGLSKSSRELRATIGATWHLDAPGWALLDLALMARDRFLTASALLEAEGLVLDGRPHPAHVVARDNLREFRQCVRQLNLEVNE